ncbi:S1 domain-containing RNA-binding protein [Halalkalibacillus halophilus]|uniref:S1 domain-containing RNA-binding protein n=1 Tax=Halalkalibacillus halophilus TaxID=392827 RepID=UPI00040C27DC|nr:S1 domain-containing RNA-binding protein [Halalkalibacillus halophilus]
MSVEVGSKLRGKVTRITNFGAFVQLPDGATGLVHISEVANKYVKDINEHLAVGDEVDVKVLNVEDNGKIGLSIKKANERFEKQEEKKRTENFETQMSKFLKDSEEKMSTLKKHTESRRGGGGAKRG